MRNTNRNRKYRNSDTTMLLKILHESQKNVKLLFCINRRKKAFIIYINLGEKHEEHTSVTIKIYVILSFVRKWKNP